ERSIAILSGLTGEIRAIPDTHAVRLKAIVVPVQGSSSGQCEPRLPRCLVEPHLDTFRLHVIVPVAPVLLQYLSTCLTDILRETGIHSDGVVSPQDRLDLHRSGCPQARAGVYPDSGLVVRLGERRRNHRHKLRSRRDDRKTPYKMGGGNPR